MRPSEPAWRQMTQAELDSQYDHRTLVPDVGALTAAWIARSEAFALRHGRPARLDYGPSPVQGIDLFAAPDPVGLHVHYHGGAWRALESRHAWWLAEPWLDAGFSFAAVDFRLVPETTLAGQVSDARAALRQARHAHPAGASLVVSGHSSGAHLAAMTALVPDDNDAVPPCDALVLASGLYDLEPVRFSARNDYLALDDVAAAALSPARRFATPVRPEVTILWAAAELDEFRRQSRDMAEILTGGGATVRSAETAAETHFHTWDMILPDVVLRPAPR